MENCDGNSKVACFLLITPEKLTLKDNNDTVSVGSGFMPLIGHLDFS